MIRRYIAAALIVAFFSYAAYLILTDGGKSDSTITFSKMNENIQKKFMILTGQLEPDLTPEELAKEKELKEAEAREKLVLEMAKQEKMIAEKMKESAQEDPDNNSQQKNNQPPNK